MYWLTCKCLAGVLLSAATLKLLDGQVPVSFVHMFGTEAATVVHLLVLQWELLLGVALLLGIRKSLVHRLTLGTFFAFAAVSFWSGWVGQSDCGCFGSVSVSPWLTFGFDLVAVLLLVLTSRSRKSFTDSPDRSGVWRFARVAALAVVLFNGVVVAASVKAGSAADALTRLRGTQLSIDGVPVDLGDQDGGQTVAREISVRNHLGQAGAGGRRHLGLLVRGDGQFARDDPASCGGDDSRLTPPAAGQTGAVRPAGVAVVGRG